MVAPTSFGLQYVHLLNAVRYLRELLSRLYDDAHGLQKKLGGFSQELRWGSFASFTAAPRIVGRVMQTPLGAAIDDQLRDGAIRNIFLGTVVGVVDALLKEPLQVFDEQGGDKAQLGPFFAGYPFWRVVRAMRNMHEHHKEWGHAKKLTKQQKYDKELSALFGAPWNPATDPFPFGAADMTLDVLDRICGSYADLESHIGETASGMVTALGLDDDSPVVIARAMDTSP